MVEVTWEKEKKEYRKNKKEKKTEDGWPKKENFNLTNNKFSNFKLSTFNF